MDNSQNGLKRFFGTFITSFNLGFFRQTMRSMRNYMRPILMALTRLVMPIFLNMDGDPWRRPLNGQKKQIPAPKRLPLSMSHNVIFKAFRYPHESRHYLWRLFFCSWLAWILGNPTASFF